MTDGNNSGSTCSPDPSRLRSYSYPKARVGLLCMNKPPSRKKYSFVVKHLNKRYSVSCTTHRRTYTHHRKTHDHSRSSTQPNFRLSDDLNTKTPTRKQHTHKHKTQKKMRKKENCKKTAQASQQQYTNEQMRTHKALNRTLISKRWCRKTRLPSTSTHLAPRLLRPPSSPIYYIIRYKYLVHIGWVGVVGNDGVNTPLTE